MKTKRIRIKSILKSAIASMCLWGLFTFPALADFSNPGEAWGSSPAEVNNSAVFKNISASSEGRTIWNQGSITPLGGEDSPLLRAKPGGGTGQKEEVPAQGGIWILTGMVVVYGITLRNRRRTDKVDFYRRKLKTLF